MKKRNGRKKSIKNFNLLPNKSKPISDIKFRMINFKEWIHLNKQILSILLTLKNLIALLLLVIILSKKLMASSIKNKNPIKKLKIIVTVSLKKKI